MYSLINHHIQPLLAEIALNGGLDEYKYLADRLRQTNTAHDSDFQKIYRSYWSMGPARLSPAFCTEYFNHLEELKGGSSPDLTAIARRLYSLPSNLQGTQKLHFSFSTKMAHMLEPERPVYDSLVAQFFFLSERGDTFEQRLANRLESYEFIVREYGRVQKEGLLRPAIDAFRSRFEIAQGFSDTKIVDTLIWRFVSMLNSGALRRAEVSYA